jgi:two-component system sensor histidine kinase DesK
VSGAGAVGQAGGSGERELVAGLDDVEDIDAQRARWASGWRRIVFPGVFLVYLGQTGHGIGVHSTGVAAVAGYVILAAFATAYVWALPLVMGGPHGRFWWGYGAMVALMLAELPFAHEDAFVMATFVVVLSMASLGRKSWPIIATLLALTLFLPPAIPSWDASVDTDAAVSIGIVALAMYGFFEIVRSNRALTEARAEVARLATENERSRIARDLHDLLGHSLTTITVKAGLARRMADVDPARAVTEIGEVEELARRSLSEVRAAVAGYRDVTLTGELASGRELLRAAGIDADLPRSTEAVRPDLHELFGWVVREGLTNVVRHARATRCTITLGADSIEIVDDGPGTITGGPTATHHTGGSGLAGLHERVAAAGGTLDSRITTRPAGWRLYVVVPPSASPGPLASADVADVADAAGSGDPSDAAAPPTVADPAGATDVADAAGSGDLSGAACAADAGGATDGCKPGGTTDVGGVAGGAGLVDLSGAAGAGDAGGAGDVGGGVAEEGE